MKIERAPMALVSMLLATAIACATNPSAQLIAARQAYVADRTDENGAAICAVRDEIGDMLRLKGFGA